MYSFLSSIMTYPFSLIFKNSSVTQCELENQRPNLSEFHSFDNMSEYFDRKNFKGVITSLNNGEGVINNEIYFSAKNEKNSSFKIGDKVEGVAVRQNSSCAWRTFQMSHPQDDWECSKYSDNIKDFNSQVSYSSSRTIIGKITSIYMDMITLDCNICFNSENCICNLSESFIMGDWLECEVNQNVQDNDNDDQSVLSVKLVSPLRRKTVHGVVSYCHRSYFVINNEIFCPKSCVNNFKFNTKVFADVIESDQLEYSWRAIKVWKNENETRDAIMFDDVFSDLKKLSINDQVTLKNLKSSTPSDVNEGFSEDCIHVDDISSITLNGLSYVDYFRICISNSSKTCIYHLEDVQIPEDSQLKIDKSITFPVILHPLSTFKLAFMCTGRIIGLSLEKIILKFENDFVVEKDVEIIVLNKTSYQRKQTHFYDYDKRVIKGTQPLYASPFIPVKLPRAEIPNYLWNSVLNDDLESIFESLKKPLCIQNYEKFSTLLYLEEIEMNLQMRKFDISCTNFSEHGEYLSLVVEGLSESRPSLMIGDSVLASPLHETQNDVKYEGVIHEVLHSKVLLKFHPDFHSSYGGEDHSVQLRFNRTPMRRCHQAVSFAPQQLQDSVLFLKKILNRSPQVEVFEENVETSPDAKSKANVPLNSNSSKPLTWFNESLNDDQRKAVKRILEGRNRPTPYIIFGPPGTGKTVTLVEVILQIYFLIPHSRILVVSPSNSASDLVAERTIKNSNLKPGDIVRINAFNRNLNNISEDLAPYCITSSDLKVAIRHRIIVSTAISSGLLYTARIKNGHFTHVIVDEAGQLTEPETLVALNFVNSESGQIVLAGDPKQLGPVVVSSIAKKFGLNISFLLRLCSSVIYQPQDRNLRKVYMDDIQQEDEVDLNHNQQMKQKADSLYDSGLVTLLTKNYRSHPDLLYIPSKLFYNSLLSPSSENNKKNTFLDWKELPNPTCPIIFHPVIGENVQEGDSPSWFNPSEVFMVCHYVLHILKFGVDPHDIGIISPYKKQVEKIRRLLVSFNIDEGVKVGPVEEFQGQEKLAVIVSTVRSSQNLVQDDVSHNLGFVSCAQRFNVAITRAIGLLIVIGNPFLLSEDINWKQFINYCLVKNAVKKF
ncbi:UNVERIFIED_CONTAM: hypothetical protein RMT77_013794 [Armadillidium vulgare]